MSEPFDWNKYRNKELNELIVLEAWVQDFITELFCRNIFFRILFRIAVGKYAYREFAGIVKTLDKRGHYLKNGYSSSYECEYHKDKLPFDYNRFELSR